MKYSLEIEINKPRKEVVELFSNPENLAKWQPGFIEMSHLSGTPGKKGAQSKMLYQMGKRRVEMVETIEEQNLPETFHATYDAKMIWNRINNFFHENGPNKTLWVTHNEFKGRGLMWLMPKLMPNAFKKQSLEFLKGFKHFAERA